MTNLDKAYWQGKEPKTTEELISELHKALRAAYQWLADSEFKDEDDKTMVYAQIFWLEQLLKLSDVSLSGQEQLI